MFLLCLTQNLNFLDTCLGNHMTGKKLLCFMGLFVCFFLITVLFKPPTAAMLLSALLYLCEPPAARLGHNDEDDEEEADSPDGSYRQHHHRQYVWNKHQGDKMWLPVRPAEKTKGSWEVQHSINHTVTGTKTHELTGLSSVWHFYPDGSIRQQALGRVCSHGFSLTDWITVLHGKTGETRGRKVKPSKTINDTHPFVGKEVFYVNFHRIFCETQPMLGPM